MCGDRLSTELRSGYNTQRIQRKFPSESAVIRMSSACADLMMQQIDGLLAYGGSSAWYVAAVPNPAQVVSQIPGPVAVTFQWLGQ